MRQFSTAVQTVLDSDLIEFTYLIKLSLNSTYYLTSNSHDLEFEDNVYIANGGLYEFDSPRFSTVIDRESYKIVISEVLNQLYAEFRNNVIGKDIEVFVALKSAGGDYMLGADDVLRIYKGTIDKPTITNDFNEKLAVIEGTSPMSDLDMSKPFITSRDGMDQKSSTDTSFDEIYKNSEINLKWGKI